MRLICKNSLLLVSVPLFFFSCSVSKQISKSANETVLTNKALTNAHVGISIFDPSENKYLYNFQGDKYFVPASNTKIPTCYAAMKYLGDSLVGLKYKLLPGTLYFQGTGDPTFLNSEFKNQRVISFLKNSKDSLLINLFNWKEEPLGSGWAWNDYEEAYMAERSVLPVFGNIRTIALRDPNDVKDVMWALPNGQLKFTPKYTERIDQLEHYMNFDYIDWDKATENIKAGKPLNYDITRALGNNKLYYKMVTEKRSTQRIPLSTRDFEDIQKIIKDTLQMDIYIDYYNMKWDRKTPFTNYFDKKIYSEPTDSLLKPMMHRSDNFFAEQSLLMVSDQVLGFMNDSKIIDTILKTDFKDLPQKPRWADGSGLSRYNLFTPQDFVTILNKMKNEFGMERIKVIFPTGGEGTISSYYKADSGYIYGKTGTLSGVVAFSGFMYTKKGKLLIFSTLVNNHQAAATDVRRAVEKFLQGVRNRY